MSDNQPVTVRFDGVQEGLGFVDNLCFTVMSHFAGKDGRDYFKSSWIGIESLLRNTGIPLDSIRIVERENKSLAK